MTIHWNNDLSQSWSAVKDFVHGAVIDNAVELWHFLPDVTQYVLGSDETLGAGRATGWRGLWRTYDDWGNERANPITGPIYRSIDVVNTMVYGSLDLVLAHTPDALFNQQLGWNIPYFHPAPKDARGMGRDIGMVAVIAATPALKTEAYQVLGIEAKSTPVAETKLARDLQRAAAAVPRPEAPVLSPAPVFMVVLPLLKLIAWVRERVARHAGSTAQRDLQTLDEANIATLTDAAPNNSEALNALVELARVENETALAALEKLATSGVKEASVALRTMACDGDWAAFRALKKAATSDAEAAGSLCIVRERSQDASMRADALAQAKRLRVAHFAKMARSDASTLFDLAQLADIHNVRAQRALALLDITEHLRRARVELTPIAIHAMMVLARFGNEEAVAAMCAFDITEIAKRAQTSGKYCHVLGDFVAVGHAAALLELAKLMQAGNVEAQSVGQSMGIQIVEPENPVPMVTSAGVIGNPLHPVRISYLVMVEAALGGNAAGAMDMIPHGAKVVKVLEGVDIASLPAAAQSLEPAAVEKLIWLSAHGSQAALTILRSINRDKLRAATEAGSVTALAILQRLEVESDSEVPSVIAAIDLGKLKTLADGGDTRAVAVLAALVHEPSPGDPAYDVLAMVDPQLFFERVVRTGDLGAARAIDQLCTYGNAAALKVARTFATQPLEQRVAEKPAVVVEVLGSFTTMGSTAALDSLTRLARAGVEAARNKLRQLDTSHLSLLVRQGDINALMILRVLVQLGNHYAAEDLALLAQAGNMRARDFVQSLEVTEIAATARRQLQRETAATTDAAAVLHATEILMKLAEAGNGRAVSALRQASDVGNTRATQALLEISPRRFAELAGHDGIVFAALRTLAEFHNQAALDALADLTARGNTTAAHTLYDLAVNGGAPTKARAIRALGTAAKSNPRILVWLFQLAERGNATDDMRSMAIDLLRRYNIPELARRARTEAQAASDLIALALVGNHHAMHTAGEMSANLTRIITVNPRMMERFKGMPIDGLRTAATQGNPDALVLLAMLRNIGNPLAETYLRSRTGPRAVH